MLKIKISAVKGSGVARIHTKAAAELGVKSGANIGVRKEDKLVVLRVAVDDLLAKDEISIREHYLKRLAAKPGEKVEVIRVVPVKEIVKKKVAIAKKKVKKVRARVRKRLEKVKKRLKKKPKK